MKHYLFFVTQHQATEAAALILINSKGSEIVIDGSHLAPHWKTEHLTDALLSSCSVSVQRDKIQEFTHDALRLGTTDISERVVTIKPDLASGYERIISQLDLSVRVREVISVQGNKPWTLHAVILGKDLVLHSVNTPADQLRVAARYTIKNMMEIVTRSEAGEQPHARHGGLSWQHLRHMLDFLIRFNHGEQP